MMTKAEQEFLDSVRTELKAVEQMVLALIRLVKEIEERDIDE